tara:strand:- start:562 stop:1203 length:642 start_codon:yes stop_codon:yes gene_type:complete
VSFCGNVQAVVTASTEGNFMAVDHPHGGGEDRIGQLMAKIKKAASFFSETILGMASTEGDLRLGGVFVLMNEHGDEIDSWTEGELSPEDTERFYGNAFNKCKGMYEAGVVCSGIIASPDPAEVHAPIYDGGHKLENGWYLAFSGFRAVLDRTYCILVANMAGLLKMPGLVYNTIMVKSPDEALVRGLIHSAIATTMSREMGMALNDADEENTD